ncbi:coiled-coil domain-containing protein 40 [Xenentodon cancila]
MQNGGEDEGREEDEEDSGLQDEARGDTAHMTSTAHMPNLSSPEDVRDQEPPQEEMDEEEEEEEKEEEGLTILDLDHPLVRKYQDGMTAKFRGRLEQLSLELDEKKNKLEDSHCTLAEAKTRCLQVKDQLEETKRRFSIKSSQHSQVNAEVSRLQTELDKVLQHLVFTQGVSEDLHSKVKTMSNVKRKLGAEKTQAEEQKLKQDLYIERLTKDVERLSQQVATYEGQARAQAEEKSAVRAALYESEMVIETVFLGQKQLLQQWNNSLMAIRRRDEAFSAMQEAGRLVKHQVILLDREIDGHKKSLTALEEENESLTMQLNWSEVECVAHQKRVSQKQTDQEALQACYNNCSRTLHETERTLAKCTKEIDAYQTDLNNQRRCLEKESSLRLELEDKIMTHMQQKLSHNKAAQDSQHLMRKMATLKKAKICHFEQLMNELLSARLESQQVEQQVSILALTQEALDEELDKCNKLLTTSESQMSSLVQVINQKGQTITNYNHRLSQIKARTGREDLSPLQLKAEEIMAQIEKTAAHIKTDQQLWMRQQGALVMLSQEMETKSREMCKLQTEYIVMQQRKIRFESQNELEEREEAELEKTLMMLNRDLLKLSSLVSEKKQLSQALEQDNALMETEYLQKLQEAEWESVNMQMNLEKVQEEIGRLLNALVESEQQLLLWERKVQILKETFSTVDTGQEEIKKMKDEIRRMEVRIEQLKKQQESLMRESETVVETWENITLRKDTMARTSRKKDLKGELKRSSEGLQRKISETCSQVKECEQEYRELEQTQAGLRDRLVQEKQRLIELFSTMDKLDSDLMNLQDTKETNFAHLVTLQSRSKKLRAVHEGSYKTSSSSETVDAALQSQMDRLQAASTILQRQCEEVPEHRGAVRKALQALAARMQTL